MSETSSLYRAATECVALADLSHRLRWLVKGADAIRFIHGQCTNDVNRLAVGEGCYACFLTIKGKLRGDAVIYRLGESLGIETDANQGDALRSSLERFIIADDVQIEDVTQVLRQGLVTGPKAAEFILQNLPGAVLPKQLYDCAYQPGSWQGDVGICRTHRAEAPCYELFAGGEDFGKIWSNWAQAAPSMLDAATLELLRIEAGIPKFGVDMDENTIPIEAGLESRAISYTKGCYIGQEVISRIHSLGHVNRHLCKLRLGGVAAGADRGSELDAQGPRSAPAATTGLPGHGTKIQVDGKDIGQVTSAVFSPRYGSGLALGYVRREHAKPGTQVSINNQVAEVIELCAIGS
jgi:folate-binding protein YgfZ